MSSKLVLVPPLTLTPSTALHCPQPPIKVFPKVHALKGAEKEKYLHYNMLLTPHLYAKRRIAQGLNVISDEKCFRVQSH